ncbi:ABC transporter substrate-binding protein [Phaeocystidibacter luteus]|uniref:ABC transporter substrate-binding protein n=2 Tax=Phaeocystidibacter luteus TaxID=911197 RepID=A0A6N6RKK4_9FLAO|nr:ABC transporter substrate-binding protein [Phaeocystidibacter luteus]
MLKPLGILITLSVIFASCSNAPEVPSNTVFRYNEPNGITSLDPAFAREQSNIWAVHQVFNGLTQMDSELNIEPCIAESWTIQDSGLTYIFKLRNDVLFHPHESLTENTRKVTANDVVYSLNRLSDSKTASPGAWTMGVVDTLYALSDDSLIIVLNEPFAPFLGILSMKYCSIVPREVVEVLGSNFGRSPIGTGPFKFQMWSTDEKLVLRRNPDYFEFEGEERLPHLEAIAIDFITDRQAAFMEFLKEETDMLSGLDASYKDELLTRDGQLKEEYADRLNLQIIPYLNTEYLAIHAQSESSPLHQPEVRLALNLSIDRSKMMRYLRNGIGRPADGGMIPRGIPAYNPDITGGYTLNLDSAKQLLLNAGYPDGRGMPSINLTTTSNYLDICEFLQASWNKLGIPVQVEVLPPPTMREGKAKGTLEFFRASWIADYPDAENYMSLFYGPNFTPNGPNYTFFSNSDFDALYDEARYLTNPDDRDAAFAKMDSILVREAPVVPLFYDEVVRFIPKNVHGLEPNALNLLEVKRVRKD